MTLHTDMLRTILDRTVTSRQRSLLALLVSRSGCTVSMLARAANLTTNNCHNQTRGLEAKGFVAVKGRYPSRVNLTPEGAVVVNLLSLETT